VSLLWHDDAWDDYLWWQTNDRRMAARINRLIKEIKRDPAEGIGKPEMLRNELSGFSSRRIDSEHRIVYRMDGENLEIAQCRYHYSK
jgi:toxin YoeB